jgi:hypothetical protein
MDGWMNGGVFPAETCIGAGAIWVLTLASQDVEAALIHENRNMFLVDDLNTSIPT